MFQLIELLPCTEDNRLYYEMAVKIVRHNTLGSREQAVSRLKYLKEYAQKRYPASYESSSCPRLAKLSPDSAEYYQALVDVLEWRQAWELEDYWKWYKGKFSLLSFVLQPFTPGFAAILNTALDMNCDHQDWNEALKIVAIIDLYRLAKRRVAIDVGDCLYTLTPLPG